MRDNRVYLELISESIVLVERYIAGQDGQPSQTLFAQDTLTQDAVLRRLEILADAAAHLSEDLKANHPGIPWRRIGDFPQRFGTRLFASPGRKSMGCSRQ